ncbi:GNAT family N-acetyltransferase [Gemella sp.]
MIRKATKEDFRVVEGLFEFIKSLEIDIFKDYSEGKIYEILEYVFASEYDRFSYKNCTVFESDREIKGFSFTYHYDEVEKMKKFWYDEIISYFGLKEDTIIFDYDEVLQGEFYLDTLFVFSDARGEGIGNKLLTEFVNSGDSKLSLNVAQSNERARKLYESYGFKKNCEIFIGHENYDHLIKRK